MIPTGWILDPLAIVGMGWLLWRLLVWLDECDRTGLDWKEDDKW